MLARSILAVVCGALAVAAIPEPFLAQEQGILDAYYGPNHQKWVAGGGGDHPPRPPAPPGHPPPPPRPPPIPHPPHHPDEPRVSNKTIYQLLEGDSRFKILFKLVNFTETITHALNDTKSPVTFFAAPDKALRPPKKDDKHRRPHHPHHDLDEELMYDDYFNQVTAQPNELSAFSTLESLVDSVSDDKKDKKRKRVIKHLITAILSYHIIPAEFTTAQLIRNTTYLTSLKSRDGAFGKQNLRLRVSASPKIVGPPSISINFISKVVYGDVRAENGYVHVVNHPLLPPAAAFETLFILPDIFSTVTSALQRVGLDGSLEWGWNKDTEKVEGTPALTFFAPTNGAFKRLPIKLKLWLFSPFGERALKKILSYHVSPGFIFYTNWAFNATAEDKLSPPSSDFYEVYDSGYQYYENGGAHGLTSDKLAHELQSHVCRHRQAPPSFHRFQDHPSWHSAQAIHFDPHFPEHPREPGYPYLPHPHSHPHSHIPPHPHPSPIYTVEHNLTTLLGWNHTIHVKAAQFLLPFPPIPGREQTYVTKVLVNGEPVVAAADIPARNGAVLAVTRLLLPQFARKHRGPHKEPRMEQGEDGVWRGVGFDDEETNEWEDWEEWLPQWANED